MRLQIKTKCVIITLEVLSILTYTYLRINIDIISEIIKKLDISNHEIISCNTEEIYLRKGIDVMKIAELKFDDKTKNL